MAATFADFVRWPARQVNVLAELTPGYVLSGVTKTGGRTFVYEIAMPRTEAASITVPHQTIYRPVVGVQENATALTPQTSVAKVDANAGTYCGDQPNERLYIHSTTGASPDTFISYLA